MLEIPIEDCIKAFESIYKTPIPASLLIVGNREVRAKLLENVKDNVSTLICGPNGTGKDTSLREVAEKLSLEIIKCVPLKQADVALSFGKAPFYNNNNHLYLVDMDSYPKKQYSVLLKYIKESERPFILIAQSKNKIHKRLLKELKTLFFSAPSPKDVEYFLKAKYNWNGNIEDIYDEDMRIVIARVLADPKIESVKIDDPITSQFLAFNIGCGYTKPHDFEKLQEPLWWVIRWIAFNQRKKFPKKIQQLDNLEKLAEIDRNKFYYPAEYTQQMLLGLNTSPRRGMFTWPPWPKKKVVEEVELVTKIKKRASKPKPKEILKQVDFTKWL